jgi:hypothetical protein
MFHYHIDLLPDETLQSYITRYHLVSGDRSFQNTCKHVFDMPRIQLNPILPLHLNAISSVAFISPEDLLDKHTGFPLIRMFLPPNISQSLRQICPLGDFRKVWTYSIFTSTKASKPSYWKLCPLCFQDDKKRFGIAYWHLNHQFEGVNCCYIHGCYLQVPFKSHYPSGDIWMPIETHEDVAYGNADEFRFAMYTNELYEYAKVHSCVVESRSYMQHLNNHGYLTKADCLRNKAFKIALENYWGGLSAVEHICGADPFRYAASLVRGRYFAGYFKHALLMAFLCETPETFFVSEPSLPKTINDVKPSNKAHDDETLLELIKSGRSFRAIHQEFNVGMKYLERLASISGVSYVRRLSKVMSTVRRRIIMQAIMGKSGKEIAQELGVSSVSVQQVISCINGLVQWRKHLRTEMRRKTDRAIFCRVFQTQTKGLSISEFRQQYDQQYMWLYNNDKEWLDLKIVEFNTLGLMVSLR